MAFVTSALSSQLPRPPAFESKDELFTGYRAGGRKAQDEAEGKWGTKLGFISTNSLSSPMTMLMSLLCNTCHITNCVAIKREHLDVEDPHLTLVLT
ncbi:hypothetical protein WG66_007998 [Moniliophthora roreri]|nr:hypothetical protein WG66_007998 [Moniliophthora roreri]